jgi:hypothetical protein
MSIAIEYTISTSEPFYFSPSPGLNHGCLSSDHHLWWVDESFLQYIDRD